MKVRIKVLLFCFVFFLISFIYFPHQTDSANLTTTKDTLQSSRLSFAGRVKSPTVAGSSHVWIYTSSAAEFYSITTAALRAGDSLTIGDSSYTIGSIVDTDEFTLTTNLDSGDAADPSAIYLKSAPQHVLTFNTASSIAGGFFRVLIPAATSNSNDGNPDSTGFDFNTSVTLTPTDTTGYTFLTNTATASGGTNCPSGWHCFEFHYIGAGGISTAITLKLGNTSGATTPIAPAPASGHTVGTADTYTFKVQNFVNAADPTGTPTDQTQGKIGVIEAVRVTATVDPTITFSIAGVSSGGSACGITTDVTTTATAVPFGTLSLNTFFDGAQLLTVSTNAVNGYSVTAIENDQMSIGGLGVTTIPDTVCNNPGTDCTSTAEQNWDVAASAPGFGYTLTSVSGATVPFTTGANFSSRPFDATTVREVMSSGGVSDSHTANVCYRISVDSTQAAGDYENQITYTATASF